MAFELSTADIDSGSTASKRFVPPRRPNHNPSAPYTLAPIKLAPLNSVPNRLALCRFARTRLAPRRLAIERDRKSTRLNSSHLGISYAVFCLKKKKKIQ